MCDDVADAVSGLLGRVFLAALLDVFASPRGMHARTDASC